MAFSQDFDMASPANKEDIIEDITSSPVFMGESSFEHEIWNTFEKLVNANNLYGVHLDKIRSLIKYAYFIGKEHQRRGYHKGMSAYQKDMKERVKLIKNAEENFDYKSGRRINNNVE